MPLQGSGQISISDINAELGLSNSNSSLRTLSADAGFSTPDAMSEFYDYSSSPPEVNEYFWDFVEDQNGTRYLANFPSISHTDNFSFSMWVRPSWTATDINVVLFDFVQDTSNRFFLIYDYGLNRFVWRYRSAGANFDRQWNLTGANSAATGLGTNWSAINRGLRNGFDFVHLAGSYDASQTNASNAYKIYWNGVEMPVQAVANSNAKNDFIKESLYIDVNGTNSTADRDAEFDNIAFWKGRVLSAADITALYNNGTPATAAFVNQENSLDFEATFEEGIPEDTTGNWQLEYAGGNPEPY
jgi:hypothetical protein